MDGSLLTSAGVTVCIGSLILPPIFKCGRNKQSPKEDRVHGDFLARSTAFHVPFNIMLLHFQTVWMLL